MANGPVDALDRARVPGWPARVFRVWMGRGRHIIVFPLRAGRLLNFVCFVPADGEMRETWSNQSIEDAFALAAVLKDASAARVSSALRRYARVRRRRTDIVQANSRRNGERYDQVNRTADGRDRELIDARTLRAWIYDYDYDVEAEPELTAPTSG